MVSMTVTEVTTRIAIVGAVALLGLLFLSRSSRLRHTTARHGVARMSPKPRTNESAVEVISEEDIGLRARIFGARFVVLGVMSVIAGVAAGIALSLAFVIGLSSLNLG